MQALNTLGRDTQHQTGFLPALPHFNSHHALGRPHRDRCQHLRTDARCMVGRRLLALLPAFKQPWQTCQSPHHEQQAQQRGRKASVIHG